MGESGDRPGRDDDVIDLDVEEENVVPLVPRQRVAVEFIILSDEDRRLEEAYRAIEAVQTTRNSTSTALAIYNESMRKPPHAMRTVLIGMGWLGTALLTGSFWLGLGLLPLAFLLNNWENVRDAVVLRGSHRLLQAMPALRNPWPIMAHRFVKMLLGYNARVEAVRTLRQDGLFPDVADKMAILLDAVHPDLLRIKSVLRGFEPFDGSDIFYEPQGYAARLRLLDPLGLSKPAPPYAWLEPKIDFIEADGLEDVLLQDLAAIAACEEMTRVAGEADE